MNLSISLKMITRRAIITSLFAASEYPLLKKNQTHAVQTAMKPKPNVSRLPIAGSFSGNGGSLDRLKRRTTTSATSDRAMTSRAPQPGKSSPFCGLAEVERSEADECMLLIVAATGRYPVSLRFFARLLHWRNFAKAPQHADHSR